GSGRHLHGIWRCPPTRSKGITVVDRKTLDVVGAIQPAGILGPGHHIATDSKGNIYLAQTTAGMQKLVFKGMPPTQYQNGPERRQLIMVARFFNACSRSGKLK